MYFLIQKIENAKILDAGCGPGVYTIFLRSIGLDVIGMDIQKSLLETARGYYRKKGAEANFVCASLTQLAFSKGYFDMVILSEVLEHLEDDYGALRNIRKILSEGNVLILSVPCKPSKRSNYAEEKKKRGNILPNIHVRQGYSFGELSRLLFNAGFRIIRHSYCGYEMERTLNRLYRIRPLRTDFHREEIERIGKNALFSIYKYLVFPILFIVLVTGSLLGKRVGETLIILAKAV